MIPDPQIARDYLEIFEDPVIRGVIFTQTAVHSVSYIDMEGNFLLFFFWGGGGGGRLLAHQDYLSLIMRKPDFCICENKDADQLCGNREADQRLCFSYTDSTIPLLPKSEISSL